MMNTEHAASTDRLSSTGRRIALGGRAARSLAAAVLAIGAVSALSAPPAQAAEGEITYTLYRSASPSADELDAYQRIDAAVSDAVTRYNALSNITKHLNVYYAPGVPTAEASNNGDLRFGSNRTYMVEGTALHEISHTVGVGTNEGWYASCVNGAWQGPTATALVQSWDGAGARLNCGGSHIWPYGLNYNNEFSELAFDRHVDLVEAMIADGM